MTLFTVFIDSFPPRIWTGKLQAEGENQDKQKHLAWQGNRRAAYTKNTQTQLVAIETY